MSAGRLVFFLSLCTLCILWSSLALMTSGTRFEYRNIIESIRAGEEPPSKEALADAIASYQSAMRLSPCNDALHDDMALLLGQSADDAAAQNADEEASLEAMQNELAAHLSCSPTDGKAWLDFATLDIYREGFTPKALGAYRMSAFVAPGESWLAEKRLLFALQFRPLFTAEGLAVAKEDLIVLKRAHPNRMSEVVKLAQVPDAPALAALFATPAAAQ